MSVRLFFLVLVLPRYGLMFGLFSPDGKMSAIWGCIGQVSRRSREKSNGARALLVRLQVCVWMDGFDGSGLTDGGKLGAHVDDHDSGHGQGEDMHEIGGRFEDDGVCELDAPCVAFCLQACRARDGRFGPDEGAERQWAFGADGVEVAKGHCWRG